MAMGSLIGTLRDVVDDLRSKGVPVGLLKIRSFRPFPAEEIAKAVAGAKVIAVLEKDISLGTGEGALVTEIKAALYNRDIRVPVLGFVIGLGGRDIPVGTIQRIVDKAEDVIKHGITVENEFVDLKREILNG